MANVIVKVRKGEDSAKAIRRFKKKYEEAGVLSELKRKSFYMKPGTAKRYKRAMAAKKRRKAARRRR